MRTAWSLCINSGEGLLGVINHFETMKALKSSRVFLFPLFLLLEREQQDGTLALGGCCQNPSSTKAAGTLQLEQAFGAAGGIEESVPSWGCYGWPGSCWDVQQLCMWNKPRVNMKGTCRQTDSQATRKDSQQTECEEEAKTLYEGKFNVLLYFTKQNLETCAELAFLELRKESALQAYGRRRAHATGDNQADSHMSRAWC